MRAQEKQQLLPLLASPLPSTHKDNLSSSCSSFFPLFSIHFHTTSEVEDEEEEGAEAGEEVSPRKLTERLVLLLLLLALLCLFGEARALGGALELALLSSASLA